MEQAQAHEMLTLDRPRPAARLASPHISPTPCSSDSAEGGWLCPQAERALIEAAEKGDLATLKRLVEEEVNLEATYNVSAAPPAAPQPPPPLPLRLRRPPPLLPRPHRRRSPSVAPPPRLRSGATRPSWGRLATASSTASSTSSPRAPTLRPQKTW